MGALALLPNLVPAIGTVVKDVVTAVRGGATAASASKDAASPTGPTATAIAKDPHFSNAVHNRQPNNAANAAAALVPEESVEAGASKSLSESGTLAKTLSTQLNAVVVALGPCYKAEDSVFAITQVMGKQRLDAEDQSLLKDLWESTGKNIDQILATTKNQFAELGDRGAIDAFMAISAWKVSPAQSSLNRWLSNPGNSAPAKLQTDANNLWMWLNAATIVGTDTISQISRGLDQISQSQPKAPVKAAKP